MAKKVFLALSDEALEILSNRATERKRGELVSTLLVEMEKGVSRQADGFGILEQLAGAAERTALVLERMEARMGEMESVMQRMIEVVLRDGKGKD